MEGFEGLSWLHTILGSLWVPPAPGRSPNMTSGVPSTVFLLFVAILYWQAMANYNTQTQGLEVMVEDL